MSELDESEMGGGGTALVVSWGGGEIALVVLEIECGCNNGAKIFRLCHWKFWVVLEIECGCNNGAKIFRLCHWKFWDLALFAREWAAIAREQAPYLQREKQIFY